MAIGIRLGVWCAGTVASLSPALCAADTSAHLIAPPAAPTALYSTAPGDSLTVAWIAREGAIRGYTIRVACAEDRVACPDQEWFVARHAGGELASYVVRVPVPAGATMVRVGLEAVDEAGRRVPVAERYVPQGRERLGGTRPPSDARQAAIASPGPGSIVAPRPLLLAILQERDHPVAPADRAIGVRAPILLSSRGPPSVISAHS